jgi:hypothetical protein
MVEFAQNPNDPAARVPGLETLERYRSMFRDGNYFFVPDATKEFYFNEDIITSRLF